MTAFRPQLAMTSAAANCRCRPLTNNRKNSARGDSFHVPPSSLAQAGGEPNGTLIGPAAHCHSRNTVLSSWSRGFSTTAVLTTPHYLDHGVTLEGSAKCIRPMWHQTTHHCKVSKLGVARNRKNGGRPCKIGKLGTIEKTSQNHK